MLFLGLIFVLAACSGNESSGPITIEETQENETMEQTEATGSMDNSSNDLTLIWEEINSNEVMDELGNEELQFVDLREKELYDKGHIPGAINIPFEDFQQRFTELRKDKGVILICHTGRMGEESADFLLKEGFTDVANFGGGMAVWDGPLEAN